MVINCCNIAAAFVLLLCIFFIHCNGLKVIYRSFQLKSIFHVHIFIYWMISCVITGMMHSQPLHIKFSKERRKLYYGYSASILRPVINIVASEFLTVVSSVLHSWSI